MRKATLSSRNCLLQLAQITRHHEPLTILHLKRVRYFTQALTQELLRLELRRLTPEHACRIMELSYIHDIGKVCIPGTILHKEDFLTTQERHLIQQHPTIGSYLVDDICRSMDLQTYTTARDIVLYHHERFDGRGYPHGLCAEAIPIGARIVALADVYDALSSPRSYKPAYERRACRDIIVEQSGQQFDPVVVSAFLNIEAKLWRIHQQIGCTPSTQAGSALFPPHQQEE
ncbi:HD-GYP domain-containing protein [Desulfurispirillum indicum]|uniref:HD-GYP domain-containing protein n=1 Tax=Desulfurispirillum indicum TaxID=936456 RepID=UPI0001C469C6|nr:HD domain-containing phosphohydrolase [Desulfurispirillum indicum]